MSLANESYSANWASDFQDFNPREERAPVEFELPKPSWRDKLKSFIQEAAPSILVVDLSHYNAGGKVDFAALRASGVTGVILKVSESDYYLDPTFEYNWQAARDNDFAVMVYHFFRDKPAADEFDWFMSCAKNFLDDVQGNTAVALDVETDNGVTKQVRADRAFGFCTLAKEAGLLDGIYCSPGLVPTLFPAGETRWNNLAWQWVAHWTSAADYTLPAGWSRSLVKCWQFGISPTHSWTPKVTGAGTVDVNRMFFPTEADLKAWLGQDDEPGLFPFSVKVIQKTVEKVAPDAAAEPKTVLEVDTQLWVSDADDVGAWLFIGSGWVKAAHVVRV